MGTSHSRLKVGTIPKKGLLPLPIVKHTNEPA